MSPFAVKANRAVLVGTALSPGQIDTKPDGTAVRTLWGEMAWQLGGADGYAMVEEADKSGTSPGSNLLSELFEMFSPCLILVDEWVAYLRNLYGVPGLPAGSFDANLTFAQALTEAAKAAPDTLVVASLPASQIEIGGEGGEEALTRLKQTFSRVESTWRPASADESFEIVRRRLFREDTEKHPARDLVDPTLLRDVPRARVAPSRRVAARPTTAGAWRPPTPSILSSSTGSTTTGRAWSGSNGPAAFCGCLATVIHALWEGEDKNLLIMPSTVPMENGIVQDELTRYMDDHWSAVIGKDVDGPNSLPLRTRPREPEPRPLLGLPPRRPHHLHGLRPYRWGGQPRHRREECPPRLRPARRDPGHLRRRAAGASPTARPSSTSTTGGTGTPLRQWSRGSPRTEPRATTKTPSTRRSCAAYAIEKSRGDFASVHIAPDGSSDVPDEREARLVVLGPEHIHTGRDKDSPALQTAREHWRPGVPALGSTGTPSSSWPPTPSASRT